MIIGFIIAIIGLWRSAYFLYTIRSFDEFGLGYFTGSLLLVLAGVALIIIGRKKKVCSKNK